MPDTDFSVDRFLRLIGKGPEELPEWWTGSMVPPSFDEYMVLDCPFADILTAWTPDKDALLLGAGLEWIKASPVGTFETVGNSLADMKCHAERESKYDRAAFAMGCNTVSHQPGLTLARAIWAAMKRGGTVSTPICTCTYTISTVYQSIYSADPNCPIHGEGARK